MKSMDRTWMKYKFHSLPRKILLLNNVSTKNLKAQTSLVFITSSRKMFKPCRSLSRRRLKSLNWVSKIPKWVRSLTKISKLLKTSQSLKRIQGFLLNPQRKEMLILILYTLSSSTKTNWVTITTIPMK